MNIDVENLLQAGWKPRIKIVKGHQYMTLRKGNKEKSLGPYQDEVWNHITGTLIPNVQPKESVVHPSKVRVTREKITDEEVQKKWDSVIARLNKAEESIQLRIDRCPYAKTWFTQRFCSKYSWKKNPRTIKHLYPHVEFKRTKMESAEGRWHFIPHPDICQFCNPLDSTRKKITFDDVFFVISDNEELSLSQVDEMRFESIERLDNELRDLRKMVRLIEGTAKRRVRTIDEKHNCIHLGKDGYCTNWQYSTRQTDRDQKKGMQGGKTVFFDNVRQHPTICVACPSYLPKENIKLSLTSW